MDGLNRRNFLWTGAALFIAGCQAPSRTDSLPDVAWPDVRSGSPSSGGSRRPSATSTSSRTSTPRSSRASNGSGTAADPYQRAAWTRSQPQSNINRMGRVNRITLHHEGFPNAFYASSERASAERLELIRTSHTNRGWADIGYHYVVDRGGRVWEGRPIQYQGAHVGGHNENNLGVMLLGNFDLQSPTDAQVKSMQEIVRVLRRRHSISHSAIHTHQELRPSACPGQNLQPRIAAMRSNQQFA